MGNNINTLRANFNTARLAWGERPTQANYDTMRAAYAVLQRAEAAEDAAWRVHNELMARRASA